MPVPPALTPALALDYVRELSADVRAGVVLDALGRPLAGPPALIDPVRALLAAAGDANQLEAATAHAVVCAVRSPAHSIVVLCGRFAIPSIVRQDLRVALAALEGRAVEPAADPPPASSGERRRSGSGDRAPVADAVADRALEGALERLISAAQRDLLA